jgi:hypothetical protein
MPSVCGDACAPVPEAAGVKRSPWSNAKAARRALSPDVIWAAETTRRILHDCHPWQLEAVLDPSTRIALCVGRGGAKTTTERARAIIKLVTLRRQRLGYAAGSKEQARLLNWDKLKEACEAYEIRTATTNVVTKEPDLHLLEASMMATCTRTGSTYNLRGVEDKRDAEKFRGYPQSEFQVDEAGSFPPMLLEYLVDSCVAPRLGEALTLPPGWLEFLAGEEDIELLPEFAEHRGGAIVLASTPPSILAGIFYEATRPGSEIHRPYAEREKPEFENWDGYSSHSWTLRDVVELDDAKRRFPALVANWTTALREKERKGWTDDNPIWMREYLGLWAADNTTRIFQYKPHDAEGQPLNQWDPPRTKAGLAVLPKGEWAYVYGLDLGSRDPFACNVFAFDQSDPKRRVYHVFGFERRGMYAQEIAKLLVGDEAVSSMMRGNGLPDRLGGLYGETGWPAAIIADLAGLGETVIDELAKVYGVRIKAAEKKGKFGAFDVVNGDFADRRLFILKGSLLEQQLMTLQWKPDEYGQPKENKADANHSSDSLTYARTEIGRLFDASPSVVAKPAEASRAVQIAEEVTPDREYSWLLSDPGYDGL